MTSGSNCGFFLGLVSDKSNGLPVLSVHSLYIALCVPSHPEYNVETSTRGTK